jgi:hypothetical protein
VVAGQAETAVAGGGAGVSEGSIYEHYHALGRLEVWRLMLRLLVGDTSREMLISTCVDYVAAL